MALIQSPISFTAFVIDDVRRDVRHAAQAEPRHAVVDHRPLRVARHQDARVLQVERPLPRLDVDDAEFLQRQRGQQLELGVAAAPLAVAVAAVGVQVRRGPGRRGSAFVVAVIGQLRQLLRRLGQLAW